MWSRVWRLLRDKANRRVLTFLGGVVVVMGVLWTAFSITMYSRQLSEQELAAGVFDQLELNLKLGGGRRKILETVYSLLRKIGGEESGYGLYSYAILVNNNDRSAKFLTNVFSVIPSVEDNAAQQSQTNIFYIPTKNITAEESLKELVAMRNNFSAFSAAYARDFFDYKMSRALLNHLCDPPAEEIRTVCEGDLSRGPYIFTYAKPASMVTPVPPPFLFVDLSDVHDRAFPEIIGAFLAQVRREDISDRAKIDTLRLKLLSIVLAAADFVAPVQKAMADMVYVAGGRSEGDKK